MSSSNKQKTFVRLNPPGQPLKDVPHTHLGIGLRAGIVSAAIKSGDLKPDINNEYSDADLLKYTCRSGNKEWFDWLLKNCDFYNSRGNVKKELRKDFEQALNHAVESGNVEMTSRLFELGSKMKGYIHVALYRAIRKGRHEMAELLFAHGGEIRNNKWLNECIHYADDRMKKIIEKGMIEIVRQRFR